MALKIWKDRVGCADHPRYRMKRKPRCLCETCWNLWFAARAAKGWAEYAKKKVKRLGSVSTP